MTHQGLPFYPYNTTGALPYSVSQSIKRVNNCNGFIAVNTGGDVVIVNGHILYPGNNTGAPGGTLGDSINVGGNAGEIFLGLITVQFQGVGPNPQVTIDQKFYILDKVMI